jgi:ATP-dependent exoDNAse (exonuclease V) alpha subunit
MKLREFKPVALLHDIPEKGLLNGDMGAIVHVYEPDGLEVEFVRPSGKTQAVVTLSVEDIRALDDSDLIAVRRA